VYFTSDYTRKQILCAPYLFGLYCKHVVIVDIGGKTMSIVLSVSLITAGVGVAFVILITGISE